MTERRSPFELMEELQRDVLRAAKAFDPSEPQRSVKRSQDVASTAFANLVDAMHQADAGQLKEAIEAAGIVGQQGHRDLVASGELLESSNPGFRALTRLMQDVDKRLPFESLRVTQYTRRSKFLASQMRAMVAVDRLERVRGEQRASAAMHAIGEAVSLLYEDYARSLLLLLKRRDGSNKPGPATYGAVINEIFTGYDLGGLPIDNRAAWLRNAAQHSRWVYAFEADEVTAHDQKQPQTTLAVEDLCAFARELVEWGGRLMSTAVHLHLHRVVYGPFLDVFYANLANLASSDSEQVLTASEAIAAAAAPVMEFLVVGEP